jgi:hypothetical protein
MSDICDIPKDFSRAVVAAAPGRGRFGVREQRSRFSGVNTEIQRSVCFGHSTEKAAAAPRAKLSTLERMLSQSTGYEPLPAPGNGH